MYQLKYNSKEFKKIIKDYKIKQKEIAEIVGIDPSYISQIANGRAVSKLCAYAICKAISSDFEIENLFKKIL